MTMIHYTIVTTITPSYVAPLTSIWSACIRTSLAVRTRFCVLVLYTGSPLFKQPWYTRTYVSWPNFPAYRVTQHGEIQCNNIEQGWQTDINTSSYCYNNDDIVIIFQHIQHSRTSRVQRHWWTVTAVHQISMAKFMNEKGAFKLVFKKEFGEQCINVQRTPDNNNYDRNKLMCKCC